MAETGTTGSGERCAKVTATTAMRYASTGAGFRRSKGEWRVADTASASADKHAIVRRQVDSATYG